MATEYVEIRAELDKLIDIISTQQKTITDLETKHKKIAKRERTLTETIEELQDTVEYIQTETEVFLLSQQNSFITSEDEDITYYPEDSYTDKDDSITSESCEEDDTIYLPTLNYTPVQAKPPSRKKRLVDNIADEPRIEPLIINLTVPKLSPNPVPPLPPPTLELKPANPVFKRNSRRYPDNRIIDHGLTNNWSDTEIDVVIAQTNQYIDLTTDEKHNKSNCSDVEHFIKLDNRNKITMLNTLSELNASPTDNLPYKFKIIKSGMDTYSKRVALAKCDQLSKCRPDDSGYFKLKCWMDTVLDIPWDNMSRIDVKPADIPAFLTNSRVIMNNVIFGQDETKDNIIQIISKMISNPNRCGNVFAVYGPPGVGKTTIIKEGMCKALNIPFAFLSLGGATDSAYLEGHSYTYEGSIPGQIVNVLRKVKCMNPIFYFDELDKISKTSKGDEIENLLIHLTDPSQNSLFQDKYLGNISLDISKSIFVFSFNDISKVSPILLDRMELIYVNGFTTAEKMEIAKNYLLPSLFKSYNLYLENQQPAINFTDDNLEYIINYENKASTEQGVRQIKHRFEKICGQLNILKLIRGSWSTAIHSILDNLPEFRAGNVTWPLAISNELIAKLLKINTKADSDKAPFGMYC